jgi:hypothetical protein
MVFCLGFLCVQALPAFLAESERPLIGERDADRIWPVIEFPIRFINESIGLVLLMALIAAFVDRTARRIARRSGAPTTPPDPAPVGATAGADAGTSTTTLNLRAGGYDGDRTQWTPAPGSLEETQRVPAPDLPQRTPHGEQPQHGQQPQYGQQHGAGRPTQPPPSAWPPPREQRLGHEAGQGGLRDGTDVDGNEDVPGQPRRPHDPDSGWTAFGR